MITLVKAFNLLAIYRAIITVYYAATVIVAMTSNVISPSALQQQGNMEPGVIAANGSVLYVTEPELIFVRQAPQ